LWWWGGVLGAIAGGRACHTAPVRVDQEQCRGDYLALKAGMAAVLHTMAP
jgi:hypothetical protein